MPDSILEVVAATVDVVKQRGDKPLRTPGEAKPMTKEMAQDFNNTSVDIQDSLNPGERFLTPAEAAARRKKIIKERKKQGLAL